MSENAPCISSLFLHFLHEICMFFTTVLAMMFDGFFATPQIHQEEQALNKRNKFCYNSVKLSL